MDSQNYLNKVRGFTLIEIIVTIVLLGIIAISISPFIQYSITGFSDTQNRAILTSQGRLILERISRELREADPDPTYLKANGGNLIQYRLLQGLNKIQPIGSTILKTYQSCRDIKIALNGSNLAWDEGNDGTTDAILADNVSNISFDYTPGSTIRSGVVTIQLTLSRNGDSIKLYREAHLRNTVGLVECI